MYTTKIVSPCEWMNSSKASKIMRQFSVRNIQFVGWFLLKIITVYKTFKSRWFFFFTLRMSLSVLKCCDIQVLQYPSVGFIFLFSHFWWRIKKLKHIRRLKFIKCFLFSFLEITKNLKSFVNSTICEWFNPDSV